MFCRNCGTQNADGVKFCRACGNPMDQAENAAPVNAAPAPGYAPNPGYNPNVRYAPRPARAPLPPIMKKIPGIAIIVAIVCALLPWFGIKYYGEADYFSLFYLFANFSEWTQNFGAVMMYVFTIACIAAPFVCMYFNSKKLPWGKFVAIGAALLAFILMFLVKEYLGVSSLKTHIGFYFYMIAMLGSGVVDFVNESYR